MDDRGRLAQPLKGMARWRSRRADGAERSAPITDYEAMRPKSGFAQTSRNTQAARVAAKPRCAHPRDRWASPINIHLPRGVGFAVSALVILAGLAYGTVKGDH